jgi:hypothetical protein
MSLDSWADDGTPQAGNKRALIPWPAGLPVYDHVVIVVEGKRDVVKDQINVPKTVEKLAAHDLPHIRLPRLLFLGSTCSRNTGLSPGIWRPPKTSSISKMPSWLCDTPNSVSVPLGKSGI